jgi:hypothetical protein
MIGLTARRRRWCRRCLSLHRTDFDRSCQKRSISVLQIGAAYLVILVDVVDGRGLAAFGYGCPLNDFQNARFSSALDGKGLRVFIHGGDHAVIRHKSPTRALLGKFFLGSWRCIRRHRSCLCAEGYAKSNSEHKHRSKVCEFGLHSLGGLVRHTAVSGESQASSVSRSFACSVFCYKRLAKLIESPALDFRAGSVHEVQIKM